MSSSYEDEDDQLRESLSSSFQKILDIHDELNQSSLPTNDQKYQEKVRYSIECLEEMTRNINSLGVFSANENIKEISTENLKYLLIPALLADFTLKNQHYDRIDVLETAEVYYNDFITRLNDYQVCDIDLKSKDDDKEKGENKVEKINNDKLSQVDSLIRQIQARNSKINRYRQMKDLEADLHQLKQLIIRQQLQGHSVDEDIERRFYLKLIRRWLNQAVDELGTIESEIPMVKMRASILKMNNNTCDTSAKTILNKSKPTSKPLKPIILTKDHLQKQVYGVGYPSIPTYSVDEFVQQKINEGSLKLTDKNIYRNSLYDWAMNPEKKKQEEESEEERKERLLEHDDPRELSRLRHLDDWKDEHRRGEGNRHNMG